MSSANCYKTNNRHKTNDDDNQINKYIFCTEHQAVLICVVLFSDGKKKRAKGTRLPNWVRQTVCYIDCVCVYITRISVLKQIASLWVQCVRYYPIQLNDAHINREKQKEMRENVFHVFIIARQSTVKLQCSSPRRSYLFDA